GVLGSCRGVDGEGRGRTEDRGPAQETTSVHRKLHEELHLSRALGGCRRSDNIASGRAALRTVHSRYPACGQESSARGKAECGACSGIGWTAAGHVLNGAPVPESRTAEAGREVAWSKGMGTWRSSPAPTRSARLGQTTQRPLDEFGHLRPSRFGVLGHQSEPGAAVQYVVRVEGPFVPYGPDDFGGGDVATGEQRLGE